MTFTESNDPEYLQGRSPDPSLAEQASEAIKNKVRQLYQFLKEANQLRMRPVRRLVDQPKVIHLSDLPDHLAVQLIRPVRVAGAQEVPDTLLRVKRPPLTRCPPPPVSISEWIQSGWDDPNHDAVLVEALNRADPLGVAVTDRFTDIPSRVTDHQAWADCRNAWVGPELLAREAMGVFEVFYGLHSAMEKDGEGLELMVADGRLLWQAESDVEGAVTIDHPVLLKRVELRFDPQIPEFTVHETDREPEIYGSLLLDLKGVAHASIRLRKNELEASGYHPLGQEDTEAFLKAFIQTVSPLAGKFLERPPLDGATSEPRLYRDMVLILRKRNLGVANAVDAIIGDLETQTFFPPALAQITGTLSEWESITLGGDGSLGDESTLGGPGAAIDEDEILLAKEANAEQVQIIKRLARSGSVIVQGPPGTGKTHTIGNLIGHLLSQGKSILVTAQTAKALRVVRDKVPAMLQPLVVSVLGSDQDARQQLESAIGSISERLTSDTAATLLEKSKRFDEQRRGLLSKLRDLNHKLREALENEYREIPVGGRTFSPSEAARFVNANRNGNQWIPAPIKVGADIELSEKDLIRLYALGAHFTVEEERDARLPLPELGTLPTEPQFRRMVNDYQGLTTRDLAIGAERWVERGKAPGEPCEALAKLAGDLAAEFSDDLRRQAWRPYAIVAGMHGGTDQLVWRRLASNIEDTAGAHSKHSLMLHHRSQLAVDLSPQRQMEIAAEVKEHLDRGGKLGFLQLVAKSEWRHFIKGSAVATGQPSHREHFEALEHHARLEHLRFCLEPGWDAMIGGRTNQPFNELGPTPELSCRAIIPEIRRCLDWHKAVWTPLAERLKAEGLKLDEVLATIPSEVSQVSEYLAIERLATEILPPLLEAEIGRRRLKECETAFVLLADLASRVDPTSTEAGVVGKIVIAVRARDYEGYSAGIEYLRRLHAVRPVTEERDGLLRRLDLVAPAWAEQIGNRLPPHHEGTVPGDVPIAWAWRQLTDTLDARGLMDPQALQREIEMTRETLRQVTQWLIDARAWGKQLERLQRDYSIRPALVGWLDTTKRLASTRQMDRRQALLSEARKLMKKCASAVPVWVMPISIMAESFDPATTRFDVVIIDEASQADLNALIPLYLGKQIVVVGDHEQVTPLGVGQGQVILDNLRKSMLQDIPNSHLFDNQFSIYDIGRQSFGDAIRLVEHFRCVPEIIAFSNQLSYDGKIRALRESNSTNIKPACVSCKVDGVREGDTNKGEARQIIDTIKAMLKHPLYDRKTIGVISMLGEAQATLIQSMIHREIPGTEIERRRIRAGISAEFQGDERNIVFLSMVDSPGEEGPLRTTGEGAFEQTKKRYNVAVSRAQDQLWVMHSFDPDLHLKANDLRLKLLQHVRDPLASLRSYNQEVGKTESPFEREVLRRLTAAGYRVKSQWQVGYYRIDMVVEGGGKRLAVECDGDRYHPIEKLADDMDRQAILERLGWEFVRIRGSAFYRNPESAMRAVFDRLMELDINPEASNDEAITSNMTIINELNKIIEEVRITEPEILVAEPDEASGGRRGWKSKSRAATKA